MQQSSPPRLAGSPEFFGAYDAVAAKWPAGTTGLDVDTEFGPTHVTCFGPEGGEPLVLLHGRGATGAVWFATAGSLGQRYRVYAPDQVGDAGRSVHRGRPITSTDDLMSWMDRILDQLALDPVGLCGHSYGAYLALTYTLHARNRIRRLALLDPTDCLGGPALAYRIRALPLLLRPSPARCRAFLAWETRGAELDPAWIELMTLGTTFPASRLVWPHPPGKGELQTLTTPTLVLLAQRSRAIRIRAVDRAAHRLLPDVTTHVLAGATHHTIPTEHPEELNRRLVQFFAA